MKEKTFPIDADYFNAEVIHNILESNDEIQQRNLQKAHNWTDDEIELFKHYIRMRRQILDNMQFEKEKRMESKPIATDTEMSIGAYVEQLEPQVQNATLIMREKGYSTFGSGFYAGNMQEILFEDIDLADWWFDKEFEDKIRDLGIEFNKEVKTGIIFICKKKLGIDELKRIWDAIADELPNMNRIAPMSQTENAKSFRARQMELRNLIASGQYGKTM